MREKFLLNKLLTLEINLMTFSYKDVLFSIFFNKYIFYVCKYMEHITKKMTNIVVILVT